MTFTSCDVDKQWQHVCKHCSYPKLSIFYWPQCNLCECYSVMIIGFWVCTWIWISNKQLIGLHCLIQKISQHILRNTFKTENDIKQILIQVPLWILIIKFHSCTWLCYSGRLVINIRSTCSVIMTVRFNI